MLQRTPARPGQRSRMRVRDIVGAAGIIGVLMVASRYLDASQAQDAGARESLFDLMTGQSWHSSAAWPWDPTTGAHAVTCYQGVKHETVAPGVCDIAPAGPFVEDPQEVTGVSPIRLRPGASCPAGGAPFGYSCDPAPAPAPSPGATP
jgi:hypothetical protein